MMEEGIFLERQGSVAIVSIQRPHRRNAFNRWMFLALEGVCAELKSHLPRAIVLSGAGDTVFSAGFDVNPDNPWAAAIMTAMGTCDRKGVEKIIGRVRSIVDTFVDLPIPIIAALNGPAYGGGAELAIRCDMRVMDPNAQICFSEVRLGLMPDWGGGAALAHLAGASRAADLILTGRSIPAGEAINLGLCNRISRPGDCLAEAVRMAEKIARNGPQAVRAALDVIRRSRSQSLHQCLDLESDRAVSLILSKECLHGVTAFLEKKEAVFPEIE